MSIPFWSSPFHVILKYIFQGAAPSAPEMNGESFPRSTVHYQSQSVYPSKIRFLVIISGKSEPGRTSAPSANGITSHRFLFVIVNYKSLEFIHNLITLYFYTCSESGSESESEGSDANSQNVRLICDPQISFLS